MKLKMMKAMGIVGIAGTVCLAGCGKSDSDSGSTAEKTGDALKNAAENTGEALNTAAENTGEALDTAARKSGEAIDTATDKTGEAIEKTGEYVEGKGKDLQD